MEISCSLPPSATWTGIPVHQSLNLSTSMQPPATWHLQHYFTTIANICVMFLTTFTTIRAKFVVAALLVQFCSKVIANEGHEAHEAGVPGMDMSKETSPKGGKSDLYSLPSYIDLSEHSGVMMAHIILMIVAWVFALPIGKNHRSKNSKTRSCIY